MTYFGADIETSSLATSLQNTTASYKYLMMKVIIDAADEGRIELSWEYIVRGMARAAWWPLFLYEMSFGTEDRIKTEIRRLFNNNDFNPKKSFNAQLSNYDKINAIKISPIHQRKRGILRYAPELLVAHWLKNAGSATGIAHSKIAEASRAEFENRPYPLYRINRYGIDLNDCWQIFIKQNIGIVDGWFSNEWANWLQLKNPGTKDLLRKINRPKQRQTLDQYAKIWRGYFRSLPNNMDKNEQSLSFYCIYDESVHESQTLVLDHYIPRSLICHDGFWNLIPTTAKTNGQKGRSIPDNCYVDRFVEQHRKLISYYLDNPTPAWRAIQRQYENNFDIGRLDETGIEASMKILGDKMKEMSETGRASKIKTFKYRGL